MINRREMLSVAVPVFARTLCAMPLADIRLGVTTDEIDDDLLTAIRFLREFHLSWAEIRNVWGKYNTAQPLDKIKEARALLDEHAIRLSVLDTPFFKIPLPSQSADGRAVLDREWKLLDGAMDRAKILGSDKVRIFGFTYGAGERPDTKAYGRIYELISEAARRAKAREFRLALENVASSYVWSGADSARLLKAVPAANLGLAWDPNNAAQSGEKPFPDGYRKLDPARIIHVHLRDYRHAPDGKVEWAPVGGGEFDNVGQIRALLKAGYKETFTLETHWRSPKGKADSTRTSLTGLLKVIEKV